QRSACRHGGHAMKLGAEPKKVAILGVLLLVAAISAYINLSPATPERPRQTSSRNTAAKPGTSPATPSTGSSTAPRGGVIRRGSGASRDARTGDFRPVFRSTQNDAQLDP